MAVEIYIVSPRIDLPNTLRLEVEFDTRIEAIQEKSADGGLMEWKRAKQYRRNALVDSAGPVISREDLAELVALATTMPGILQLYYVNVTIDFNFDYADGNPITAGALVPRPNAAATDWYHNLKIKIIER